MKRTLTIATLLVTTACTTYETPFQSASIHYNRVAAESNNELIVLNILRAKHRQPMYFSALTQLNGSLTYGGSVTVGSTLNDSGLQAKDNVENFEAGALTTASITEKVTRGLDTVSPSIRANVASNPSFQYQLLDTQEFYQGITQSIPEETIINYLEQGWDSDLLEALFIEAISGVDGRKIIENDPDSDFSEIIACYDFKIGKTKDTTPISVDINDLGDLNGLANLFKAGAKIKTDEYGNHTLTMTKTGKPELVYERSTAECGGLTGSLANGPEIRLFSAEIALGETANANTLKIRSVQSVMYFLGEYIREDVTPYKIKVGKPEKEQCIFSIQSGAGRGQNPLVTTKLNGNRYNISADINKSGVDSDDCHVEENEDAASNVNTLRTLALLNQLINLQKSSKDRPQTLTVRSIN